MRPQRLKCSRIIFAVVLGMCLVAQVWGKTSPQVELNNISDAIVDGTIREVDIMAIPKETLPKVEITPAMMLKNYQCKVVLKDLRLSKDSLMRALENTQASSEAHPVGIRRALLFVDGKGQVRYSIFLDSFGQGQLDGQKAALSGELVQWIEDRIPQEYW